MIVIGIPIFNDWSSFAILARARNEVAPTLPEPVTSSAINDGSTLPASSAKIGALPQLHAIAPVTLNGNLGPQRAIASGISGCVRRGNFPAVPVMDGHREDAPSDSGPMLQSLPAHRTSPIVGSRAKRSEKLFFRFCYAVDKRIFRSLTGESFDFGYFGLRPLDAARCIAYLPDAWNHFAATIMKSPVPLPRIATQRYAGSSSMNLVGLVMHGLSAIAVVSDRVLTRLLRLRGLASLLALTSSTTAVFLRIFTNLAIPGRAANVIGLSGLLFFQSLALLAVIFFSNLSNCSSVPFVPAVHSTVLVAQSANFPSHGDF